MHLASAADEPSEQGAATKRRIVPLNFGLRGPGGHGAGVRAGRSEYLTFLRDDDALAAPVWRNHGNASPWPPPQLGKPDTGFDRLPEGSPLPR